MNKQKRIAVLGDFIGYPSYFNYGSLEGAYRVGAWAKPIILYHIKDISLVKKQIDSFKPDIILAHCIFATKPYNRDDIFQILSGTRKKWGTKIAVHMGDARTVPRYPHDISNFADLGLINHAEFEEWSKIWRIPCIHWPYACLYQKNISDKQDDLKCQLSFSGSLGKNEHHNARRLFIDELKKHLEIKFYPDEKYGNTMFMTDVVVSSSDGVLGMQMGEHIKGYLDVRPFQNIGAGAVYFHDMHKNMNMFFQEYKHFVPFKRNNPDDFMRVWKLNADNMAIRQVGFDYCQKHHSTKSRVQMVLDFFDGKKLQDIYLR